MDDNGKPVERQLVIRRGQDFDLEFTFDRDYDAERDDLNLILQFDCKFTICLLINIKGPLLIFQLV